MPNAPELSSDPRTPPPAASGGSRPSEPSGGGRDTPVERPAAAEGAGAVTPELVKLALRKVKDPDINLNIIDLGLVYDVRVAGGRVDVDMSLTSPACPSGPQLMSEAEARVRELSGVDEVSVNLVWEPLWTPERIEPRVRAYLGF
jgi:metal-sulfur cluster biosynthetic enzyme